MAYSKAKISIPNVTGNIVITATAVPSAPTFSFTMDRTLTGGRTVSGGVHNLWVVNPPSEAYAFGEFQHGTATQGYLSNLYDIYTNMSANSVCVTKSGGGYGVAYPFMAASGKTYTFTITAAGTPRVYFGWWVDGTWTEDTASKISTTGTHTKTLTAPSGTNVYGCVSFGAGTDGNAQFTNVSVTES